MNSILILLFFFSCDSNAAETNYHLAPVAFTADASFESLDQDTFVPKQKFSLDGDRSGTLDSAGKKTVFPLFNLGYPSGATSINLGGRSSEDTQVSVLGVPLNLPQGGGVDLSIFPAFLWSEMELSPTLSSSGYSPQASSGSLQFKLWTREMIRSPKKQDPQSRVTASYDRLLQTYSLASRTENFAMVAGMNQGLMSGPAGSLSYGLLQKAKSQLIFHLLGSDQDGLDFGSIRFPSPTQHKKLWRVIPVLESHQETEDGLILESTAYADLQELQIVGASDTRTQQYGVENAVLFGPWTYALSARYVLFSGASASTLTDLPLYSSLARDFFLSDRLTSKILFGGAYSRDVSVHPLGKISSKYEMTHEDLGFAELGSNPKMPTLSARYYVFKSEFYRYNGNPSLKPERVNALLVGYQKHFKNFEATTTLKAEYRNDVQINTNYPGVTTNTTLNEGNAHLFYAKQDVKWRVTDLANGYLEFNTSSLLSTSRLQAGLPYPDLAAFSQQASVELAADERFKTLFAGKYIGPSTASDGRFHPNYTLFDASASYSPNSIFQLTGGIDNLFDQRSQVILDYPLPGRVVYLSGQAHF